MTISRRRQAVTEYLARLRETLGDELDRLVLYGSEARGDADEASDIDVLIVMIDPFDYGGMLERTSQATAELSLEYDVVLSRAFVTREELDAGASPFLMNVKREGVLLD